MDNADKQDTGSIQPGMGPIPHEKGTTFRVWAPHAEAVYVTGTFNEWSADSHPMEHEGNGYWAVDVPGARPGDEYKYLLINGGDELFRLDPYARQLTSSVGNSVIHEPHFDWGDVDGYGLGPWNELVIYEMHIGTFNPEDPDSGGPGTFVSARDKLPYLRDLGINAVEIMPPMEFPGGISWGYNPSYPFAIERDYGGPEAFKEFVKAAHEHGIAVILDVVYNHLGPSDLDLWRFDGWYENEKGGIYFYNDDRAETPWGATRPDFGRDEVRQFLRDNALMWLQDYRVDGLRFDGTAFIRNTTFDENPEGELPEGWSLMQWINDEINAHAPGKISIAEDLRGKEWLVKSTAEGGAGFDSQWDSHFVHNVRELIITPDDGGRDLDALQEALVARYDGDATKRIIYTESHDEVANGKMRVTEEIAPGDSLNYFAKKRSTLGAALVFTAPGIPMIFQGQEFLEGEWFRDSSPLDWSRAEELADFVQLYRDLIHLRRNRGGDSKGLTGQHIDVYHVNHEAKVIAYHRWADGGPGDNMVIVVNLSNEPIRDYAVGFPSAGQWGLRFDSHSDHYGADYTDQVSMPVTAEDGETDGLPYYARIAVAPYSAIVFSLDPD